MATEISVKDYALQRNKTVQAVYQQMKTAENAAAIEGHVIIRRVGNKNVKFLDEVAVDVLDRASSSAPVVYIQEDLQTKLDDVSEKLKVAERQVVFVEGKNQALKELLDQKEASLKLLTESNAEEVASLSSALDRANNRADQAFKTYDKAKEEFEAKEKMMQKTIAEQKEHITNLEQMTLFGFIKAKFKKGKKNDGEINHD